MSFRYLLLWGSTCVVENTYPPLTRCWNALEGLFSDDPAFADGIFVQAWVLMDFPFGPNGETALDYFEDFVRRTGGGPQFQPFIDAARESRLGLHQEIMRTKSVVTFRELISRKVTSALPTAGKYEKGEILLARMMTYGDQTFIFGDLKRLPKEAKPQIEDAVRSKLFYFAEQRTPEGQFETFMKLAGPYLMSCVMKKDGVEILEPDHYRTYGMLERASTTFKLKVTLLDTRPAIWRRVLVSGDVTLAKLSTVINAAMGWEGYHLHEFRVGEDVWGPPMDIGDDFGFEMKDHEKTTLAKVAPRTGSAFKYQYDGGDCWMHEVLVEDMVEADANGACPVCLEGERACPPEDCGGIPGFDTLLAAMANRKHPDHKELVNWLGGKFDPDKFDLAKVNASLGKLASPKTNAARKARSATVRPRKKRSSRKSAVSPPDTKEAWLREIAGAYADAHEAIPFGPLVGTDIGEGGLFHLAPEVCLKFRGIKRTPGKLKKATEAALTSYVVMQDREPALLSRPHMAFAFCYLAAHFGLGLVGEDELGATMDFIEREQKTLDRLIKKTIQAGDRGSSPAIH